MRKKGESPGVRVVPNVGGYDTTEETFLSVLEVEGFDGWRFTFEFPVRGDRVAELSRFSIERTGDDQAALTRRLIQRLPYGALERDARARATQSFEFYATASPLKPSPALKRRLRAAGRAFTEQRRPGRRGRSPVEYAAFASAYVDLVVNGNKSMSDFAARQHLNVATARNILTACRSKKFLTKMPTNPGRPYGELTEKALQLLEQEA